MQMRATPDPVQPEAATETASSSPSTRTASTGGSKKRGRPARDVRMQQITTNYHPKLIEAIERARARRQNANPGFEVSMSETIRALLLKALALEDDAQLQPDLPLSELRAEATTKRS